MVEFKIFLKGFVTKLFINILHYSNIFYILFQFKYFQDLTNNFVASCFPLIEVNFSINTFNPTPRLQKLLQASINANTGS